MTPVHVLTGATGFLGAALSLELLRSTSAELVALVRARPPLDATTRFRAALADAARLYGAEDLLGQLERCHGVEADLLAPHCGISSTLEADVAQVWHCAASLQYEDRHRDQIRATNVEGTRRVLELAEQLRADAFNYVSTAYVAGRASGVIREAIASTAEPNNHYERSKYDAELLVAASPLRARILRPSVVVGHSLTLGATNFSGYYGFLRQLVQFRGMMDRMQRGLLERTPIRLRIDPDAHINLVGVDVVAREAVAIATRETSEGVFHLTHPEPVEVATAVRTAFELVGLREPIFVDRHDELTWLDERLDRRIDFYRSYLVGDKQFERVRTHAALQDHPRRPAPHGEVRLAALGRWYLDTFERSRDQLPVAR